MTNNNSLNSLESVNVLVFPCGSEIGLEIYQSLRFEKNINLFGASSINNHGRFVYANYIGEVKSVYNPKFIEGLNKIINDYKIDVIIPAHDDVCLSLAENEDLIHAKVIGSNAVTNQICRSKSATYKHFKGSVATPEILVFNEEMKFPVFMKPDKGQGSKDVFFVENFNDLAFYSKKYPCHLILEYLPGEEFTIDCFTDYSGRLLYASGRIRGRISNGISVNSTTSEKYNFRTIADEINSKLQLNGAWFFQLKIDKKGVPVLLEIAPRIAGTMALHRVKGVNFALLSIYNALQMPVSMLFQKINIEIDRALCNRYKTNITFSTVYIDFDDCVIMNGSLNTSIIMFLAQCLNARKEIILITRHKGDINAELKKYKIFNWFNSVIHIEDRSPKSNCIKNTNAIFIDDSYAERREVWEKLQIPVFSPDGVECLLTT
jgi:predicted ATP-grasp superfamily ATP-dependent carboligase